MIGTAVHNGSDPWQAQLSGELPILNLPIDYSRPAQLSARRSIYSCILAGDKAGNGPQKQLERLAHAEGVATETVLHALFQLLLHRYSGQEEILVGARNLAQATPSSVTETALTDTWIVSRVRFAGTAQQPTFRTVLSQVQHSIQAAQIHPLPGLTSVIRKLSLDPNPDQAAIFQAGFLFQRTDSQAAQRQLDIQSRWAALWPEQQQLTAPDVVLLLTQNADELQAAFIYSPDLFEENTIARMAGHFQTLLSGAIADPDQSIATMQLLTVAEHQQLLVDWNDTRLDYPREQCVPALIEWQAAQTPDAIAVVFGDGRLTYGALNRRANQLARHLQAEGVGTNDIVGVCVERSVEMIIGWLGVMKAGGAYLPIDPQYPSDRLAFMMQDSQMAVLLTQERLVAHLPVIPQKIFCLDRDWAVIAGESSENPALQIAPEQLAYVIYTSGSTGQPNGVMVPHRGLLNLIYWHQDAFAITAADRATQVANMAFDASVWETWPYLACGATLYLADPTIVLAPTHLRDWLLAQDITVTFAPTPIAEQLLSLSWPTTCALRILLTGGDKLNQPPAHTLPFQLINNYGPTENSVVSTWGIVPTAIDKSGPSTPLIGRPVANTQVYILDQHGQPAPIGVPGELCVGGLSLACGYLNRPELTAERFVMATLPILDDFPQPPINRPESAHKIRLYKTGDLARYRSDGQIEFLGRLDQQVKIRGYRVELGEIEVALRQHSQIQEAVLLAHTDQTGQKYLAAYVVPTDGIALDVEAVKRDLATQLPIYMAPSTWTVLPKLPLTANGKIDRKALLKLQSIRKAAPPQTIMPRTELEQKLTTAWQTALQTDQIGLHDNFFDVGGTSLLLAKLHTYLVEQVGVQLSPVHLYQFPTIHKLAQYLSQTEQPAAQPARLASQQPDQDDIAIIGMSCRFPGANDIATFWQNLCDGVESITFLNETEIFDLPSLHSRPNYVKAASTSSDIDKFDAAFFGYSAKEAAMLDPQQRVFLECAWEALESAGYATDFDIGRVGVYAGSGPNTYLFNNVYAAHQFAYDRNFWEPMHDLMLTMAQEKDFLPTRVSYKFNLTGPSINVQTACSTSLVALHLASQALRNGECEMALAGAVSISVPQNIGHLYQEGLIFAPDGHCRAFDANAQGTVFGNGAGLVVLKPLSQALADRDHIYAVIKGSAINNDGAAKVGYSAPSVNGQASVIAAALDAAGVEASSISYLEAHGTGTELGDPVEVEALTQAFRQTTDQIGFCALGTVKSNLGHLMMAAGMPGLIKTALALQNGLLPPTLHYRNPNPHIDFANSPFYVNTELMGWPTSGSQSTAPRRAGLSSFGMGGTNAHIILEEAPSLPDTPQAETTSAGREWQLLTLSAKSNEVLQALTQRYSAYLSHQPTGSLADLCFTTHVGRKHFPHRLAVVAQSIEGLAQQLNALSERSEAHTIVAKSPHPHATQIAFLFTGQGSQYVDMGRQLYAAQPIFRAALDRCDEILRPYLETPLLEVLYPTTSETQAENTASIIDATAYTQPALFALEYALTQLWLALGIEPDVVIGHSVGEYVAACVAGVFSLEDGLKLIAARGRLMQKLPQGGSMAVVFAAEGQVARLLADHADLFQDAEGNRVTIAAVNGPENVVISGKSAIVEAVCQELAANGLKSRPLTVSHAFHSPLMEPMLAEFARIAQEVTFSAPQRKLISNVTGDVIGDEIASSDYWCKHVLAPVHFAAGMETLNQQAIDVLIEIGPKPILLGMGRACLHDHPGFWLPSLHPDHPDEWQFLQSLSALYMAGATIDWVAFEQSADDFAVRRRLPLPTYPFQRHRYWIDAPSPSRQMFQATPEKKIHPLLGRRIQLAGTEGVHFAAQIDTQWPDLAWLQDHRVDKTALMPLTGYLEMALAAGMQVHPNDGFAVTDLLIHQPLALTAEQTTHFQSVLQPIDNNGYEFQVFYQEKETNPHSPAQWQQVVSGQLLRAEPEAAIPADLPQRNTDAHIPQVDLAALRSRCPQRIEPIDFYAAYHMNYGPTFQIVDALWQGKGEVLGLIHTPPALSEGLDRYYLHPAVLDACAHILGAVMPHESYLPMLVERLQIFRRPEKELWSYARLRAQPTTETLAGDESAEMIVGDVYLFDVDGHLVAAMLGATVKRVDTTQLNRQTDAHPTIDDWLYQEAWERKASLPPASSKEMDKDHWLIFADRGVLGSTLAQQLTRLGGPVTTVQIAADYSASADSHFTLDPQQPAHFIQLMNALQQANGAQRVRYGVVYLWPLDETGVEFGSFDDLPQATVGSCTGLLHLIQALTQTDHSYKLWLITQGAKPVATSSAGASTGPDANVLQGALWGLGRVIEQEHPELGCVLLDLDPEVRTATAVHQLRQELWTPDEEQQIAYRQGMRYVARLQPQARPSEQSDHASNGPFRVQLTDYGLIENLQLASLTRRPPEPHEVEIQVCAAGLNFRDMLNALGMLEEYYAQELGITRAGDVMLGFECAGIVTAVGERVTGLNVGDEVMALADGSLASHVTVAAHNVVRKPTTLTFEEATTIPVAFLTAAYGLQRLAGLQAGDRALIHAAAGGVGQAAIQLAQRAGVEIFGTASQAKWTALQASGVDHLLNSRTLDFADEIMALTDGQGVDLVLNSLNGEFIAKSFASLAQNGRMVELGKLDIWDAQQVRQLRPDAAYFPFDFREAALSDPTLTPTLLTELMAALERGDLQPLPHTVMPISEVVDAFRLMQRAGYVGKVVLTLPKTDSASTAAPQRDVQRATPIHATGSYLITGGLGGLGLQVAQWLVGQGARQLVLSSRQGVATAETQPIINALTEQGADVLLIAADVAQEADVRRLLMACPQPLRGVVHAAGVLADGLLAKQSTATFAQVMAPKVAGSWHLHRLTQETEFATDLDFFICFSSIAAMIGTAGQGNYAAANAFMDALIHHRRALGLPALGINWGPWADVGMAADMSERDQRRLRNHGMNFITPAQGITTLAKSLQQGKPQVAVMAFDWSQWLAQHPHAAPFYNQIIQAAAKTPHGPRQNEHLNGHAQINGRVAQRAAPVTIREKLAQTQVDQQYQLLVTHVQEQVTKVLGRGPNGDALDLETGFFSAGMDSLTSIELRNYLQSSLACTLSATVVFNYPSIEALTKYLADEVLNLNLTSIEIVENTLVEDTLTTSVEQLSDDEAEDALLTELEKLGI